MRPTLRRAGAALLAAAALACNASVGVGNGGPPPPPPPVVCHAWPTASTVGIPAGTPPLTVMEAASHHTDHDGQIFDAVDLRGRLYVDHDDVAIRRSRLVGDEYYAVYTTEGATGLTIEDSDIQGGVILPDGAVGRRYVGTAPVNLTNTTVTTWEDNAFEDGETIPAP